MLKKGLFIFIVFIASKTTLAQLNEGYFQYSISVTAIDTSLTIRQQAGLLFDSKMELYFKGNLSRLDFKMGKMYETSLIVDREKMVGLSLSSDQKGKYAVTLREKEINQPMPQKDTSVKVELVNKTKTILGFNCKMAIARQGDLETVYWYTDEIQVTPENAMIINPNIPGFPLYFATLQQGMKMEYQASNYSFTLNDAAKTFSMTPPEEYRLMNPGY